MPAVHWHHLIYPKGFSDELPLVPLCFDCHAEITALNCDYSRQHGFKRLSPKERCQIWDKFTSTLGFGSEVVGYSVESWRRTLNRLGEPQECPNRIWDIFLIGGLYEGIGDSLESETDAWLDAETT